MKTAVNRAGAAAMSATTLAHDGTLPSVVRRVVSTLACGDARTFLDPSRRDGTWRGAIWTDAPLFFCHHTSTRRDHPIDFDTRRSVDSTITSSGIGRTGGTPSARTSACRGSGHARCDSNLDRPTGSVEVARSSAGARGVFGPRRQKKSSRGNARNPRDPSLGENGMIGGNRRFPYNRIRVRPNGRGRSGEGRRAQYGLPSHVNQRKEAASP